jgi:large subunit ribosomal protein L6|tara:strand:+ start:205 stop:681 length:477 start_codon:yes stop_codon:yes gene_type:complete
MKNILKTQLQLPANLRFFVKNNTLTIKGSEGSFILRNIDSLKQNKTLFYRLIQKGVIGVNFGYINRLTFVGVGYRVESLTDNVITLKLGYSHLISIKIPASIKAYSPKKSMLILKSFDSQKLNLFTARIRSYRFPDVYKGKGILFKNEVIRIKSGKNK